MGVRHDMIPAEVCSTRASDGQKVDLVTVRFVAPLSNVKHVGSSHDDGMRASDRMPPAQCRRPLSIVSNAEAYIIIKYDVYSNEGLKWCTMIIGR